MIFYVFLKDALYNEREDTGVSVLLLFVLGLGGYVRVIAVTCSSSSSGYHTKLKLCHCDMLRRRCGDFIEGRGADCITYCEWTKEEVDDWSSSCERMVAGDVVRAVFYLLNPPRMIRSSRSMILSVVVELYSSKST